MNRYEIIGHVGTDPEVNYTPSGMAICRMTVATKESVKVDGEKKEETEWHSIRILGPAGEQAASAIKKGCLVFVSGKKKKEKWTNKDNVECHETRLITWGYVQVLKWPAGDTTQQQAPQQRPAAPQQAAQQAPQQQRQAAPAPQQQAPQQRQAAPAPQQRPAPQQSAQQRPAAPAPAPQQPVNDMSESYMGTDSFPDDFNFNDLGSDDAPF